MTTSSVSGVKMNTIGMKLAVLASVSILAGCATHNFSVTVFNPDEMEMKYAASKQPVRVGICHDSQGVFDPVNWDISRVGSPWAPLQKQLQEELGVPVQVEQLAPFQLAAHLRSGRIDFAVLSAADYLSMEAEFGDASDVIAVSRVAERQGLIVADARSDIQSLGDVRGRRFAFGPKGDAVLDEAARERLAEAGVTLEDIPRELVSLDDRTLLTVGSYQYHVSSAEAAFEIVYCVGTDAGVIEAADYDSWPASGGKFLTRTFGKDDFRILAKTKEVKPDTIDPGPVVAAHDVDPVLREQFRKVLLNATRTAPQVMRRMGLAGFEPPATDVAGQMKALALSAGYQASPLDSVGKPGLRHASISP